jgi:uncharacterized protein (TIGR02646 family)
MRNISKRPEPATLTAWRTTNPIDYNGHQDMDTLRDSLVAEQRGICCYCQCRIYSAYNLMKVEHWQSHERYPQERLVYRNLLGACLGGQGKPGKVQHCDTYKGDKDLCRNPADPAHNVDALIHYLSDGRVTSSNEDLNEQLDSVLNLNLESFKESRKQELESFIKLLRLKPGKLNRAFWQRLLERETGANHDRELRPYCGVIIYWVRKHLAKAPQ